MSWSRLDVARCSLLSVPVAPASINLPIFGNAYATQTNYQTVTAVGLSFS